MVTMPTCARTRGGRHRAKAIGYLVYKAPFSHRTFVVSSAFPFYEQRRSTASKHRNQFRILPGRREGNPEVDEAGVDLLADGGEDVVDEEVVGVVPVVLGQEVWAVVWHGVVDLVVVEVAVVAGLVMMVVVRASP